MHELTMPSLGADMDHGKILEWLVKPGDAVHRGDLIATVDTDKTVMDVESFEDGVVGEYLVPLGATVSVGTPIVRLEEGGGHRDATRTAPPAPAAAQTAQPVQEVPVHPVQAAPEPRAAQAAPPARSAPAAQAGPALQSPSRRVRSSPLARRLAARLGLDLATVEGTGPQGSVSEADVRRAAGEASGEASSRLAPQASRDETSPSGLDQPARGKAATLRAALGSLMAKSKATIPHYYLSTTVDLSRLLALMQERNLARPLSERLVPAAYLLKAAAVAAREVPAMNGSFVDGAFIQSEHVHLGVAVALRGGGLVAPALHDADTLPVDDLMAKLRDLAARARAGRLLRAEMADATITVTSLGDLGVDTVFGVIVPPQVAMVGFGRVVERPWAENGMLGVRPTVSATLSADHRVSDGLGGGRYLARVQELLLAPEEL